MSQSRDPSENISVTHIILQFSLMCMIFYLWYTPVIQPVKIMVVLFHEISHGLMALLTGGKVIAIEITREEGGFCETEGGVPLMIVSAGYLGSMFFGGMILYLSRAKNFVPVVYGILSILLTVAIFTVLRDQFSRLFAAGIAAAFIGLGFLAPAFLGSFGLRVLGTVSCLYSIFDIYWDVLSHGPNAAVQNDAVVFAELSGVPAHTIGLVWLSVSVVFFLIILKIDLFDPRKAEEAPEPKGAKAASAA